MERAALSTKKRDSNNPDSPSRDRRIELLSTDEPEAVREAIADLLAGADIADWDELVRGYTARFGSLQTARPAGPLRCAERRHRSGGGVDPSLQRRFLTIAALAAASPAGSAAAVIRHDISRISITGSRSGHDHPPAAPDLPAEPGEMASIDLRPLASLPGLRDLSIEDVDDLRGLDDIIAAGRLHSLWLRNVRIDRLDLTALTELSKLHLHGITGLTSIDGLPASLRSLDLAELPADAVINLRLAGGLDDLGIHRAPLPRPASALRRLRHLTCDSYDRDWLAALTALESATFRELASTEPLAGATRLRSLGIHHSERGTKLTPLAMPRLEQLAIDGITGLTSLSGLAGSRFPAVRTVEIGGEDLVSLDGLELTAGVTAATIHANALTDIGALEAWTELEELTMSCRRLTDVTPLAKLAKLRRLDLSGCRTLKDLSPLADLKLTALRLSRTAATRTTIPRNLHSVVHPPSRVAGSKPRAAGTAPATPPSGARHSFARLKRLILTRDFDQMRQGVEMLRALDDPSLYEAFLAGSSLGIEPVPDLHLRDWSVVKDAMPDRIDTVAPNSLLAYGPPLRPYRQAAIRALVAHAPEGSRTADALRAGLRRVWCSGRDGGAARPIDLALLAALPNLEHLTIESVNDLRNKPAIARAQRLATLVLMFVDDPDRGGLASSSVTTLALRGQIAKLDLNGFPRLRRLMIDPPGNANWTGSHPPDVVELAVSGDASSLLSHLATAPLRRLTLRRYRGSAASLTPLAGTGTLTHLADDFGTLGDLTPLAELRSLRVISLRSSGASRVAALAALPNLAELRLRDTALSDVDVTALAEAPSLRRLDLDATVRVDNELPTRLRQLCVAANAARMRQPAPKSPAVDRTR